MLEYQRIEIERLNQQVARLRGYLYRIASPQGDVSKWLPETNISDLTRTYEDCALEALSATESDWLAAHDQKVRDEALESEERDAKRYRARRKATFLLRNRLQVSGQRPTEAEFNIEYDAGCDKNLNGYVTDHTGMWVKNEAMKGKS